MKPVKSKPKKKRKYWVFITRSECVLCGRGGEDRERRYDKKPKDLKDRCAFEQYACNDHF